MVSLEASDPDTGDLAPTRDLGAMVAALKPEDVTDTARRWAAHCVLDWIAVTVGGAEEPLTRILIDVAMAEAATGPGRLIGHDECLVASQAALVNGAASHALDYDDVNQRMNGHPTVPVVPALMAMADEARANGDPVNGVDFLTAFVAGYEVETLLAEMSGFSHYDKGWHGTATYGTFGAAAACAKLLGLDADQSTIALGIAATQAAGLKAMFGTMCKPLHAGKAASNGLLAARLAARGFTSRPDAIECPQGFAATQAESFSARPVRPDPAAPFAVEQNLFKYHAACYLTHAGIDALKQLKDEHGIVPEEVRAVRQHVPATHFTVCHIPEPETGLEVKFSMRHTAAMALAGVDTGAMESYDDAIAARADLVALRDKVEILARDLPTRMQADVVVELKDGRRLAGHGDAGVPAVDLDTQEHRLSDKFRSLVTPVFGEQRTQRALKACLALEHASDATAVFDAVSGRSD